MSEKKKFVRVKVQNPIGNGFSVGDEVRVEVDSKKTPIDRFWRDRFKDADIDNCVKVITPSGKKEVDKS